MSAPSYLATPRRSALTLVVGCLLGLAALAPADASAVAPEQERHGRSFFDVRTTPANETRAVRPPAGRLHAAEAVHRRLGRTGVVELDRITGTPRQVARVGGFLTVPAAGSPESIVLDYVRAHPDLFGLDGDDIAALRLTRDYKDVLGTTHLVWAQTFRGIRSMESGLRAAVTRDGRIVNVGGSPKPDLELASAEPALSPGQALAAARRDAGTPAGARGRDDSAELTLFMSFAGPRLAWRVRVERSSTEVYGYVIDAGSGRVLRRENTVKLATGLAWDKQPAGSNGGATSRSFPAGWLTGNTALRGPYAHTYLDVNDDNSPGPADEVPASGGNWNYPFNGITSGNDCSLAFPCSWSWFAANSWDANKRQNATQVFYFVNTFHDWLRDSGVGFTAAAGNFENVDAVQAEVLDGANIDGGFPDDDHINNANMATPPDGDPPRMQMYLMSGVGPNGGDVNAGDDASVIYHEYAHGLSSRLVTDSNGVAALGGDQAGAMGEGWSDWYAMDYLVQHAHEADTPAGGEVTLADYITGGGTGFRTQALDCPVGVSTAKCAGGGHTYGDFGEIGTGPEVHDDGEIWAQALWDMRRRLIADRVNGAHRARTYVTRAMELSPPNPSFLDMRNAILQAERVATIAGGPFAGTRDRDAIWAVFAGRGMGYYASTTGTADTDPVEDYSLPPTGAGAGSLSGTVLNHDTGGPVPGARVALAGHYSGFDGAIATTSTASGAYTLSGLENRTYPHVFAGGPGWERGVATNVVVSGATSRDFTIRRNWAQLDGGADVASFTGEDYSAYGCGPEGAIDGSLDTGWGSDAGAERSIVVRLPRAVNVTQFGVDPGATCGDDDTASVGPYRIETSSDGAAFSVARSGTFGSPDNHRLNLLAPTGATGNVSYVRFTMIAPQSNAGSGARYMDLSEFRVYGSPVASPAPTPDPGTGPTTTTPSAPAATTPPSNVFTLGRTSIMPLKGLARLTLTLPGPGQLKITGKARRIRVIRISRSITRAGRLTLTLRPSRAARRVLRRRGRLRTALRITYTPTGGTAHTVRKTLTFRLRR
jgi:hypothetical protein